MIDWKKVENVKFEFCHADMDERLDFIFTVEMQDGSSGISRAAMSYNSKPTLEEPCPGDKWDIGVEVARAFEHIEDQIALGQKNSIYCNNCGVRRYSQFHGPDNCKPKKDLNDEPV